ncbi:hypothetical protein [Actinomadura madurae]|uniref:hypothetical protein n=1 Tax=Actinomadura madurae TaxID=1993 RepID=UPI0020D25AB5|nr:hypothetical protein [Actinomadura madurae]MCQ0018175.1 hypothetical protein [Actinomadura madurae]
MSTGRAHRAVKAAGGKVVHENRDVGVATVRSSNPGFIRAAMSRRELEGVAHNRVIGEAPKTKKKAAKVEKLARRHQRCHEQALPGGQAVQGHRAARGPAVGHEADPRDGERLVQEGAG